ncbi:MAG: hypothetical protein ABS57_19975 [Mesorhizobium sp. SCN 65-12]|nr:MAG: hypothetical protein ABS57_19975 [Mesorhizobium sp. SCN 65-12]
MIDLCEFVEGIDHERMDARQSFAVPKQTSPDWRGAGSGCEAAEKLGFPSAGLGQDKDDFVLRQQIFLGDDRVTEL